MQKSKLLIQASLVTFFMLYGFLGYSGENTPSDTPEKNIANYMKLLEKEPGSCFYTEQIAANYQAINKFDQAIQFYEQALDRCSDNLLNQFQLGICYYLTMDRNVGIEHMDKAIDQARKSGDKELEEMFRKEKEDWLKKWNMVKEMKWNRNKE